MVDTRYITHSAWTGLTCTQTTYPNNRNVTSGYDSLYRRNSVTETSSGKNIATWQFFGNRTATTCLGNGITCSYMNDARTNSAVQSDVPNPPWGINTSDRLGYDGSGRLITKRYVPSCGGTTPVVGFTTQYDPSSNKLFERALQAESRSALYPGYDSMDRLLEYQRGTLASGGASVTTPITLPGADNQRSYDLDGLGNWKNTVYTPEGESSSTTEIRQHNKLNEITQFATTPVFYDHGNNTGTAFPNRGNGNIVDDGTRVYGYDALNRLTTVTRKSDNALVAAYIYDALGRRVQKVAQNGGISNTIVNAAYRYLYDGQQIIEEGLFPAESYSTLRQFVWGRYIDELIQINVPTTTSSPPLTAGTYYPLQDLLYRTTATTNASGAIAEAYDYDAYGNTLMFNAAGAGSNWWADDATTTVQPMCENLFTGRQYDPETEIYWYRERYYAQSLGRFIGRDPIGLMGGPNAYSYCVSNVSIAVDPFGLQQKQSTQPSTQPTTQPGEIEYRQLTWQDFQGQVPPNATYPAATFSQALWTSGTIEVKCKKIAEKGKPSALNEECRGQSYDVLVDQKQVQHRKCADDCECYQCEASVDKPWRVFAVFFPSLSYMDKAQLKNVTQKELDVLLRHEQGHFNITNQFAKEYQKKINSPWNKLRRYHCLEDYARSKANNALASRIQNMLLGMNPQIQVEQKKYDLQTAHGTNQQMQDAWNQAYP